MRGGGSNHVPLMRNLITGRNKMSALGLNISIAGELTDMSETVPDLEASHEQTPYEEI